MSAAVRSTLQREIIVEERDRPTKSEKLYGERQNIKIEAENRKIEAEREEIRA